MDETRFEALAAAYGGDMARWPEDERAAAHAFAQAEPETARAVLAEAGELDAWLAQAASGQPETALFDAVMASAPVVTRPATSPRWIGLAASLTLMVGAGAGWMAAPSSDPFAEAAFAEAFGALEDPSSLDRVELEEAR